MCDCVAVKEVWEYDGEISMIYRWTQELIGYHFTVLHRSNNMMRDVDALTRRFSSLIIQHIHTSNILQHMDVTTHPRVYVSERPLPRDTTKLTSEPITVPKVSKRLTTANFPRVLSVSYLIQQLINRSNMYSTGIHYTIR